MVSYFSGSLTNKVVSSLFLTFTIASFIPHFAQVALKNNMLSHMGRIIATDDHISFLYVELSAVMVISQSLETASSQKLLRSPGGNNCASSIKK